ncbi:MAG: tRNA (adenosine(37)-N6)-threonylcarbamoyltransferase complex ATPase subunit type 1 TsaE [Herpetosiphonaceae bacterium]|nr:tRNA (adenosine(37)-N6)-threonylcarbamoyltransferase complex ATPase subunit type 1 TsaE [Herpetosiphonaceae bacterium]
MCANDVLVCLSHSEADTIAFGQRLGALLQPGDLVLLQAPFGAGKTHLTKGIGAAWGIAPDDITSPSFVLVNEYITDPAHGHVTLYHADLYRIETAHELATMGIETLLSDEGICVIEWPEHAAGWLPADHLLVKIALAAAGERLIRLEPHGLRYRQMLDQLNALEMRTHAAGN